MPRDINNVFTAARNWLTDAASGVPFSAANWQQQDTDFAAALNDLPVKSTVLTFVDPTTDPTTLNPGSLSFAGGVLKIVVKVSGVNQWFNGSTGTPFDFTAYYSRTQIDAANVTRDAGIALKAPLASPQLTGTPTLNGLALTTQPYVQSQVGVLTASAPGSMVTFLQVYNQFVTDEAAVAALTTTVAGKQAHTANLDSWSALLTTAKQDHSAYLDGWSAINPATQPAGINFTPVQQGGGSGQFTNKIYIGWTGTNLGLQIDTTTYGFVWPISISGNATSAASATTAATASAVPWTGVTGRPTAVSAFTNDAAYATTSNVGLSKVNGAFNAAATVLSGASYSVTLVATGVYDVAMTAGVLSNAVYGVVLSVQSPRGTPLNAYLDSVVAKTATSFRVVVVNPAGTETAPVAVSFAVMGG